MVLGCTHYPLLKPLLRRLAPPQVTIVDSAESTAQAVARSAAVSAAVAGASSLPPRGQPALRFFSTDSVEKFRRLGARFLGHPVEDVAHVDLDRLP
jgi:glutamate racemase